MSKFNLTVDQGTTFQITVDITDEDDNPLQSNGNSISAQIRKHYLSTNSTSFSTNLSNGVITLTLSANQTSSLSPGRHVYDVELTNAANTKIRIMEGIVTVNPEVTR